MSALTDRASLLREFFRLVNADSEDTDMTEHDGSTLEGAYEALDVGLRRAQMFAVRVGRGDRWLETSAALSVSGTYPDKKATLPADFFRLDSDPDQDRSGLKTSSGRGWGREVTIDDRDRVLGSYYWVREEDDNTFAVYFARGSAPPALVADYYRRATTLADTVDADFRADDRHLIAAEAAEYARKQSWFVGDAEASARIRDNVMDVRREVFARGRLTRRNRRTQRKPSRGRWIV